MARANARSLWHAIARLARVIMCSKMYVHSCKHDLLKRDLNACHLNLSLFNTQKLETSNNGSGMVTEDSRLHSVTSHYCNEPGSSILISVI